MPGPGKGAFISFEGIEGTGKSTQARLLAEALGKEGIECVLTAEPGGTKISRRIREVLLDAGHGAMEPVTELLLYAASRRQHLEELIRPALGQGKVVITDRFSDSTAAYQGSGRGIDIGLIDELDRIVTGGMKPDLTILLEVDVEEGLRRNREAGKRDRLELEDLEFHRKVHEGFREIAGKDPGRVRTIHADRPKKDVHAEILRTVREAGLF